MKYICFIVTLVILNFDSNAQASYHTQIAFKISLEAKKVNNLEEFTNRLELIDVFGNVISKPQLQHILHYNEETKYLTLSLTTIGPRFSFAIKFETKLMVIYLPFRHNYEYYAVNIKFKEGRYLLDYDIKRLNKIFIDCNLPYYIVPKINYRRQKRKLDHSSYSKDKTYTS